MQKFLKGILLLCLWGIGLWAFFALLTPWMEDKIPAWKRYNQIQEEQNLDSGALYYSNVPQTQEAEEATRAAVSQGMAIRREARMKQKANEH